MHHRLGLPLIKAVGAVGLFIQTHRPARRRSAASRVLISFGLVDRPASWRFRALFLYAPKRQQKNGPDGPVASFLSASSCNLGKLILRPVRAVNLELVLAMGQDESKPKEPVRQPAAPAAPATTSQRGEQRAAQACGILVPSCARNHCVIMILQLIATLDPSGGLSKQEAQQLWRAYDTGGGRSPPTSSPLMLSHAASIPQIDESRRN